MAPPTSFPAPQLLPLSDPPHPIDPPHIATRRPRIAFTLPSSPSPSASPPRHHGEQQQQWIATSHFYPAAWPRSHPRSARSTSYQPPAHFVSTYIPLPSDPQAAKAEERRRREADFAAWKHQVSGVQSLELLNAELSEQADPKNHAKRLAHARQSNEEQLWVCIQRIAPSEPVVTAKGREAAVERYTLIVSHANGLHKEVWEPALASLVESLESPSHGGQAGGARVHIDEIWSFDCAHSGEAASINRDKLGDVLSWFDHPRDMLQFLDHYLPDTAAAHPSGSATQRWHPTLLKRTDGKANARKRKLILLGHSFGGVALSTLVPFRPDSFEGLIMVDPAFIDPEMRAKEENYNAELVPLARGAVARKDTFPTWQSVHDYCLSKPFFQAWDAKVLDLHLRFGTRPVSVAVDRAVTSDDLEAEDRKRQPTTWANSKWLEAQAFGTTFMGLHALTALEEDRSRAWIGLISMKGGFDNKSLQGLVNGLGKGLSLVLEGNHLVVQEEPVKLGQAAADLILTLSNDTQRKQAKLLTAVEKPRL
ncbi:hypothetical protein ACQY0O_006621 [Thecaphora frezii]